MALAAACSFFSSGSGSLPVGVTQDGQSIASFETTNAAARPEKTFALTAEEKERTIEESESVEAWTYNGSVPGQELRVEEGDFVQVDVTNNLDVPVTIHWHGVNLANNMDGAPGLIQNAVQSGESFTYKFVVEDPEENGEYNTEETLMLDKNISRGQGRNSSTFGLAVLARFFNPYITFAYPPIKKARIYVMTENVSISNTSSV